MRQAILRILNRRFGADAELARLLVEEIANLQSLETLVDAALDAPSLEAFIEQAQTLPREADTPSETPEV